MTTREDTLAARVGELLKQQDELERQNFYLREKVRVFQMTQDLRSSQILNMSNAISKLAKFKAWVHEYLDKKGVPADPDPEGNAKHGCRISGRMEWVFRQLYEARAERDA